MIQYAVRMDCQVTKIVTCEGGTEEEIRADPWKYAIDEQEVEQTDWEITSVKVEG